MSAVTDVSNGAPVGGTRTSPAAALPEKITAQVLSGGRPRVSFTVPAAAAGPVPLTVSGRRTGRADRSQAAPRRIAGPEAPAASGTDPSTTPASPDATCAISVDDPAVQAYQPDFQQVEWAADQAVHGDLTTARPAGLYGSSLPSYTPPLPGLTGGGTIPAQVLLGVLTQESNLEQASTHVIQGQTSNPLTAFNWFGNWVNGVEGNTVNWSQSDCGYGIGQVTTGMCLTVGQNGDKGCTYDPLVSPSPTRQLAVAVDYQANIAASARILANAWNQLAANNMSMTATISGTNYTGSQYIQDWYMALWAYNSGLEPNAANGNTAGCPPGPDCTDAPGNGPGGNWGLGYANNPANAAYPPDRPRLPRAQPQPLSGAQRQFLQPQLGPVAPAVLAVPGKGPQLGVRRSHPLRLQPGQGRPGVRLRPWQRPVPTARGVLHRQRQLQPRLARQHAAHPDRGVPAEQPALLVALARDHQLQRQLRRGSPDVRTRLSGAGQPGHSHGVQARVHDDRPASERGDRGRRLRGDGLPGAELDRGSTHDMAIRVEHECDHGRDHLPVEDLLRPDRIRIRRPLLVRLYHPERHRAGRRAREPAPALPRVPARRA